MVQVVIIGTMATLQVGTFGVITQAKIDSKDLAKIFLVVMVSETLCTS